MRKLIKYAALPGILAFVLFVGSMPSAAQAWWPPGGNCYVPVEGNTSGVAVYLYQTCQSPSNGKMQYVGSAGFNSGGVMTFTGTIYLNGSPYGYSGCQLSNASGSVTGGGYVLPPNALVVGVKDCLTGVVNSAPVSPFVIPPGVVVVTVPQPAPSLCNQYNNWCQSPIPAPTYTPFSGCLTLGNIAAYVGGNSSSWSVLSYSNGEGLKYVGPSANLTGPSQGRVDYPNGNIRNGQVATYVTEATYWCHG